MTVVFESSGGLLLSLRRARAEQRGGDQGHGDYSESWKRLQVG